MPDNVGTMTCERWSTAIDEACAEPDPVRSNQLITSLHYRLSEALADTLGREGGPNFHTWAVWGSRKAGATIRQEDLDSAMTNATVTAGIVGAVVGIVAGIVSGHWLGWRPDSLTGMMGAVVGAAVGAWTGRQLAIWSRRRAAELILQGNQVVILDIGKQSARFLEMLEDGATSDGRCRFFAGLRAGPTERHGQDRLAQAFHLYLLAFDARDTAVKRAAMIQGNCDIVYHEHIQLEPYIKGAMPFIVRRCATDRLMTYEVGETVFTVGDDLPGIPTPTAARDWTKIDERMRYVFALFTKFHCAPEVFSKP